MIYLRTANADDVDTIFQWRHETAQWLASTHRSDQWSTPYPRNRIEEWVNWQCTLMGSLERGGPPIATITISTEGDPKLWTPDERDTPAWYLYKANVMRHGRGIGETLFAWVRDRAVGHVEVLRLDVWTTNLRLQQYYRDRLGARPLRTVPGTVSGALLEMDVHPVPDIAGRVCADDVIGWLQPTG